MDAITMIKERRSTRKFKDEKVDRQVIKDILSATIYAPTWANTQINRFTLVDEQEILKRLANEGIDGFEYNSKLLKRAAGALVVSAVKGKSGRLGDELATSKGDSWEMFDAGIAAQTFCLAAYAYGIGTVILGIFDEEKVAEIIELPDNEYVTTIIPYGYEVDHKSAPKRKSVEEVTRFL